MPIDFKRNDFMLLWEKQWQYQKKRGGIMKRILILFFTVLLFTACSANNDEKITQDKKEALKVQDYFPIVENTRYVYEGTGNEYATYTVYTEYTGQGKVQQRVDNGGTVTARVYEIKGGKLTRLLSRGETYYRENLLGEQDDSKEILLKEPLKKGKSWTLKDGRVRKIASVDSEVTTPSGKYTAIEVVTEGSGDQTTDYYAKGVGLVKSVFKTGDSEVTSSLKSMEKDISRVETIRFYYPNSNADKIIYVEKEVSFRTNDSTAQVLEDAYKTAVSNQTGKVLSTNTKINSLKIDKDNKVRIDLNEAFRTEMNAGSGYESMILQSIANTLGRYYGAQEVILTVEGKPYESGHVKFEEGQSIPVKFEE